MVWTEEDIEKVRKFIEIKRRGHYAETHELTSVYNRVLEKHVNNTTCGSCLRQRVEELERALRQYEADKAKKEAEELLALAQDSGFSTVEEARLESEIIMQEHEEETKEENNNGTEGKSPTTTKKRKASKPKTT